MAVARRHTGLSIFPEAMKGAMRRKIRQIGGLAILAAVGLAALALMTWTAGDPSLSHATNAPVKNWVGRPGAILADLLMQLFGLGAIGLIGVAAAWGWRFVTNRPFDREGLRIPLGIAAGMILAVAASVVQAPRGWPLPTGIGGVIGDGGLAVISAVAGNLSGLTRGFVAIAILGLGLFVAAIAAGVMIKAARPPEEELADELAPARAVRVRGSDDQEPGRLSGFAANSLGALAHGVLSAKAKLKRMAGEAPDLARAAAGAPAGRAEPATPGLAARAKAFFTEPDDDFPVAARATGARREPVVEAAAERAPRTYHAPPARVRQDEPEVDAPRIAPGLAGRPPVDDEPPFEVEPRPAADGRGPRIHAPAPAPRPVAVQQKLPLPPPDGIDDSYELPPLDLLTEPKPSERDVSMSTEALQDNAATLASVLDDFGVRGEIINVRPGPVVTLYELEPAPGTRSNRVIGLADDIARSMSAVSARVALVPGRNAIGIELPNARRENVLLREMLASQDFITAKEKLPIALGKTIGGDPVIADLAKMPHLLVAGTTGSGKSVAINTMILSLVYRLTPAQCRLIMVDPKMLELSIYDGIPHLLTPVVTDPKKAVVALKWAVREMEERYKKMSKLGVRNIDGFNARMAQARSKGELLTRTVQTGFDRETGEAVYEQEEMGLDPIPYIVVIVDEMADLMMVAGKDIEGAIQRLAQMARAAGIHLIMATQRPSVDVITGTIKANFPTRISFQVTSKIDSRTILGEQGAEQLLGRGDMLFMAGGGRISRVHGPFVSDEEVERIVGHLKQQGAPDYLESVTTDDEEAADGEGEDGAVFDKGAFGDEPADLYDRAIQVVMRDKKASTSYIQRRLQIGYNRAASLIERMEREGIVGPANHAGKREILLPEGAD
ncbi:DNA translocase FtsK [Phreatobacter stygius]|uniref:DNA translocase FtsK n=2 Tax=Phreatobacter stygius TaxID=1940610 RepID=A0A4D7BDX7_9HYPH|nr:DNA translocase FtsK [Phreatobacter stygius]QCI69160.1 DNA translocase FtsK [Phreatobacter stygius]